MRAYLLPRAVRRVRQTKDVVDDRIYRLGSEYPDLVNGWIALVEGFGLVVEIGSRSTQPAFGSAPSFKFSQQRTVLEASIRVLEALGRPNRFRRTLRKRML